MSSMWLSILAISSALMLRSPSASRSANSAALSPACLASTTPTPPPTQSTARGQLSSHAAETKHRATARCTVRTLSHERGRIPEVVAVGVIVGVLQAVVGGGDFVAAAGCRCRRAYEGLEAGLQLDGGGGAVAGRRSGSLLGVAADRGSVLGGGRCARRRGREEGDQLLREGHLESEGGGALSGTLRLCRCRHG